MGYIYLHKAIPSKPRITVILTANYTDHHRIGGIANPESNERCSINES